MRSFLLSLAALTACPSHAFYIRMHGIVTEYFSGEPIKGAQVRMVKDGIERETQLTKRDGQYEFILDRGYTYLIWFYKDGWVTKHVKIDATGVPPIPDVPFHELDVQVSLFTWVDGVDLTIFEQPLGLAEYVQSVRKTTWDVEYTEALRPKVERVMIEYQRRMGKLAHARPGKGDAERREDHVD